jgi:tRNA(Ile)-lysidine synthetase-like protein
MLTKINELLDYWFSNSKIWFNCTLEDDNLIKSKYQDLLLNQKELNIDFTNNRDLLGLIILNDQISRHVFRSNKSEIKKYDEISIQLSKTLLSKIDKNLNPIIESFNPQERCFILMPLRHTINEENIKLCLDLVTKWREENDDPIYNRFFQATIKSLININDSKNTLYLNKTNVFDGTILDDFSIKTIEFIDKDIQTNKIFIEFKKNMDSIKIEEPIILSISGGVDSMICSYLLYYYSLHNKVISKCITINYNNRDDQIDEINMVNIWLQKLNMEHHVRHINEIKRTRDKDRDFYEKITREIRFNSYKKLGNYVILGHNKDDTLENIFSNIKKKNSYDNLLGMDIVSIEKEITILRPLLNVSKADIISFAKEFNIPFVKDSTPKWSERGKMRDILIPQVKDFDNEIIDGLLTMSKNFKEIYSLYKNFIPTIEYYEKYCIVEDKQIYFFDYWKNIITKISNYYKCDNIKNKSIINMINCIKFDNRITLSKQIIVQNKDNKLCFNIMKN